MKPTKTMRKMKPTKETIRNYIVHKILHKCAPSILSFDQILIEDGTLDSLSIIHLVGYLETQYSIEISSYDMTLENFESINKIAALVDSKICLAMRSA